MRDNDNVLSALDWLDASDMDYEEWLHVGMGLKHEGYPFEVWDDWSSRDRRPGSYSQRKCLGKWNSFNEQNMGQPITGATIIQMAKDKGWTVYGGGDGCLDWGDVIEYDGDDEQKSGFTLLPDTWSPTNDLKRYLRALFEPDEYVGYIVSAEDAKQDDDGKWTPCSKGSYRHTAGQLIESLDKHPNDLGATIGDWNPEAGAWIRINPLDGEGVKDENITAYRFALVESDSISVAEQDALYRKLELPIAALVHSGGKSLHAVVHIDAKDKDEYKERVTFLYNFLNKNGLKVDTQNKNASRLSRIPGVTRNGNKQYLVGTSIGYGSWNDWKEYIDGIDDNLPNIEPLSKYLNNLPERPEPLIEGVLRRGHKMLLTGPSKAGKSFLLMELCIAIAEGVKWLTFQCRKGRVLYVNVEIDKPEAINRFYEIYDALGLPPDHVDDIVVWNLRGRALPLDELAPKLIYRAKGLNLDAIVIDPIYKVIKGDENNATEMGAFCNQFDKICNETGCAAIYSHHHGKSANSYGKAMDRASGSGVFARDPDTQLVLTELALTEDVRNFTQDDPSETGWRLESSLREFANIAPINLWFKHPLFYIDETGELSKCAIESSRDGNLSKSPQRQKGAAMTRESFDYAFGSLQAFSEDGKVRTDELANYFSVSVKTVRNRAPEFGYGIKNSVVYRELSK